MFRFAQRLEKVELSQIRQIMRRAEGCANLGIGEPDFPAPRVVRSEAHRVLEEEKLGYSANAGIPELRESVRRYHGGWPEHDVCVTNGSQEALFDALFTAVSRGEEVLYPDPGFPAYRSVIQLAGGSPISYPMRASGRFRFDSAAFQSRITSRTRAAIINSPCNPTGQCLFEEDLRFIIQTAQKYDLLLVSDEIYREIHFLERRPPSVFAFTPNAIVLSGVSKMASMTGWRLGWACGPAAFIEKVTILHQYSSSCASTLSQKAALKVFGEEGRREVEELRNRIAANRRILCDFLETELKLPHLPPQGAFYVMLDVSAFGRSSFELSLGLLDFGVATIPGTAFGEEGEGYLRISFACSPETLQKGLERLKEGLSKLRPGRVR